MYGLLFESIQHFIQLDYGEEAWQQILEHAGIKNMVFTTHKIYRDQIMLDLAASASHVVQDKTSEEYLGYFGTCFVDFCASYGYDKILRTAGRNYRDFLIGIDNLHETIRFSYPKLKSPSFIVESEDANGCTLIYRSVRQGYTSYVAGQLSHCAKKFYNVDVKVTLKENVVKNNRTNATFRLEFDNKGYDHVKKAAICPEYRTVLGATFLKLFPFCILFDEKFVIQHVGESLANLIGNVTKTKLEDHFSLRRPLFDFTWENILSLQKVIFELEAVNKFELPQNKSSSSKKSSHSKKLLLKGQMKLLKEWKMVAFLCTPLITNLEDMQKMGLYINDLNMFDNSREMVLKGWHNASQLEHRVDQQVAASKKIEENLKQQEQWRRKGDLLLYSMMPITIAKRLKNGEDPINTCETFDCVTIMFCYFVGFDEMCGRASPLQVVEFINNVFIVFDDVVDRHKAFKVETLGDAIYMVAGGVPDRQPGHTERLANLSLEFVEKASAFKDPLSGTNLQARIGMHIGSIAAGLVGRKTSQYCLFGDTVNTASRMQSYGEAGKIHISEPCKEYLQDKGFIIKYRGYLEVKGKGLQTTYWLEGREDEEELHNKLIQTDLRKYTRKPPR
ncbi:hypothetical protein LOTGIDRAFT_104058 [Lottia gigantea]|uniref:guanylate cyclase n=1 Tax=Lottia gigantea TaxID=225164 RepID=V4AS43_LOTGI|nr:hypothetical protein LOTGIDRAFT_104058 [Lottia gigantea]ESO97685.1 hypothetical protein LOTGIDRAFT_104058 [Lottia gigantea]